MTATHVLGGTASGFRDAALGLRLDTAAAVLDRLPFGVLLLDDAGGVLHASRVFEALLAQDDGLRLHDGGLHALRAGDDERLQRMIARVLGGNRVRGPGAGAGASLAVPRRSGRRAYALTIEPLPWRAEVFAAGRAAAVVFAQDLDTRPSPSAAQLAALHGLTPREGQLAARLLAGDSLDEAARTLAITPGTARNYLASLFTKTRTRRQGELLALLLRSTPAYC